MRLHSSWTISVSATNTSWLGKKEERGRSAKATATRRTRNGSFLGGYCQPSCASACLHEPPIQVTARNSRTLIQFFILTPITLCSFKACRVITEDHAQTQSFRR